MSCVEAIPSLLTFGDRIYAQAAHMSNDLIGKINKMIGLLVSISLEKIKFSTFGCFKDPATEVCLFLTPPPPMWWPSHGQN